MMLEELCRRPLQTCFGFGNGDFDELVWEITKLKGHASGEYSMAVVQANSPLEDQAQVLSSDSATLVGVFDGHGGPAAARFISSHLFSHLLKYATEQGGISVDALQKAYSRTEKGFLQLVRRKWRTEPQFALSGSCCLVGAICDGTLYVANLGDSRAVLGRAISDGRLVSKTTVIAERLTSDHNVGIEEVRQEVQALHPDDKHVVVFTRGVWRVKGIIQVSRAIGDVYLKSPEFNTLYQKFGFSSPLKRAVLGSEPSISVRKLKPDDLFLIFASDGFWEHFSDAAAVEMVYKNPRIGIARRLAGAAMQEVARKTGFGYGDLKVMDNGLRRQYHDDITVIVIYLDNTQTSLNISAAPEDRRVHVSTFTPSDVAADASEGY